MDAVSTRADGITERAARVAGLAGAAKRSLALIDRVAVADESALQPSGPLDYIQSAEPVDQVDQSPLIDIDIVA